MVVFFTWTPPGGVALTRPFFGGTMMPYQQKESIPSLDPTAAVLSRSRRGSSRTLDGPFGEAIGNNRMPSQLVRKTITATAVVFAVFGLLLLFAAEDLSGLLGPEPTNHPLQQLLGAALLGFAAMNWIARAAALGGIYGRAVVAGNQTHLTIGAMLLLKRGVDTANTEPWIWALAILYALGAAYFSYLMFFHTGIEKQS
jgi:hypothetical protein